MGTNYGVIRQLNQPEAYQVGRERWLVQPWRGTVGEI